MATPITTMSFRALDRVDPDIANLIRKEYKRQSETLELIASFAVAAANRGFAGHRIHCDLAGHERVLEAWSSIPTNSEPSA